MREVEETAICLMVLGRWSWGVYNKVVLKTLTKFALVLTMTYVGSKGVNIRKSVRIYAHSARSIFRINQQCKMWGVSGLVMLSCSHRVRDLFWVTSSKHLRTVLWHLSISLCLCFRFQAAAHRPAYRLTDRSTECPTDRQTDCRPTHSPLDILNKWARKSINPTF